MHFSDRCEIGTDELDSFEDVHDKRDEVMLTKCVLYRFMSISVRDI